MKRDDDGMPAPVGIGNDADPDPVATDPLTPKTMQPLNPGSMSSGEQFEEVGTGRGVDGTAVGRSLAVGASLVTHGPSVVGLVDGTGVGTTVGAAVGLAVATELGTCVTVTVASGGAGTALVEGGAIEVEGVGSVAAMVGNGGAAVVLTLGYAETGAE